MNKQTNKPMYYFKEICSCVIALSILDRFPFLVYQNALDMAKVIKSIGENKKFFSELMDKKTNKL